ncbi:hypothetical protein SKAU_G00185570 [Synaphobranchus kaupii]|uniref:Uncharacterized protein n=1 Tax=Synaphobranchus kaupii TaxID=118154 RepID=A0A9Q1IWQ5_SYNKA|nr:hypothetical protein SKAU_G00185570 [Synaphobranchus kaupii]
MQTCWEVYNISMQYLTQEIAQSQSKVNSDLTSAECPPPLPPHPVPRRSRSGSFLAFIYGPGLSLDPRRALPFRTCADERRPRRTGPGQRDAPNGHALQQQVRGTRPRRSTVLLLGYGKFHKHGCHCCGIMGNGLAVGGTLPFFPRTDQGRDWLARRHEEERQTDAAFRCFWFDRRSN